MKIIYINSCSQCCYHEHAPQELQGFWGFDVCHHWRLSEDGSPKLLAHDVNADIPDYCPLSDAT